MRRDTPTPRRVSDPRTGMRHLARAIVPGAGGLQVLRLLVPGACRFACTECPMRGPVQASDWADPLALGRLVVTLYRRGRCDGVYLTAGIPADPVASTERMIEVAEALRLRLGYRAYLHVKVPSGATALQAERIVWLADRVSSTPEPVCAAALGADAGNRRENGTGWAAATSGVPFLLAAQSASGSRAPAPLPARKAGSTAPAPSAWPRGLPGLGRLHADIRAPQPARHQSDRTGRRVADGPPVQGELFPGSADPARGVLRI